jgi:hypothetical protein
VSILEVCNVQKKKEEGKENNVSNITTERCYIFYEEQEERSSKTPNTKQRFKEMGMLITLI